MTLSPSKSHSEGVESGLKYMGVPWTFVEPTAMPTRKVRSTLSVGNVAYSRGHHFFNNTSIVFNDDELAVLRMASGDDSGPNGKGTLGSCLYLNDSRLDLAKKQHQLSASNSRLQVVAEENEKLALQLFQRNEFLTNQMKEIQAEELLSSRREEPNRLYDEDTLDEKYDENELLGCSLLDPECCQKPNMSHIKDEIREVARGRAEVPRPSQSICLATFKLNQTENGITASNPITKPRRRLLKIIEPISILQCNKIKSRVSPQLQDQVKRSFCASRFSDYLAEAKMPPLILTDEWS
ncbi:hypothetical protein TRFO_03383 [Tritrichomonas foetus]|uniref:Uncharacterized protein n=1 Tax=Tritrichomonas foetus TaxID=1144522 RepID=A0A1J4KR82_9EUKA|nr:hypothetical protein TRFO_03383 [Tritrichomonas foetus]|eukprot:OHT13610.1 hypothetical protein TRFO_03383 [Tritrichomonas foetus]